MIENIIIGLLVGIFLILCMIDEKLDTIQKAMKEKGEQHE